MKKLQKLRKFEKITKTTKIINIAKVTKIENPFILSNFPFIQLLFTIEKHKDASTTENLQKLQMLRVHFFSIFMLESVTEKF